MRLVIIGAGGHGQVVYDAAKALEKYLFQDGHCNILFLDDRYEKTKNVEQKYGTVSYDISGMCRSFEHYIDKTTEFYPAFGNNEIRLNWAKEIERMGGRLATIIHPTAYVSNTASIKAGTVVLPHAVINTGCSIGKACIINVGSIIDHGCVLNDGCHVNSGAIVMAENIVPSCKKVDSGEVIRLRQWYIEE